MGLKSLPNADTPVARKKTSPCRYFYRQGDELAETLGAGDD
jgi:hypothetical protein